MHTATKILGWALAFTCTSALAAGQPLEVQKPGSESQSQTSPNVDNTKLNKRDKGGATKTPQDQTNQVEDRKLLAAVRRAIMSDKSLSTLAHNVKLHVEGGALSLRGPVKSDEEKAKVEALAKQVKGITTTDNQLDVKTKVSAQ